jgi:quercetin dioxygenase-like cupin family protein
MQITRNSLDTTPGPSEWFTGAVYIDTVATPSDPSRLSASSVHFTPGARTAWHTHPCGQTIYVTEGVGLCQRRGFMTHLAMQEADEGGSPVKWGEHVSDEAYGAAPSIDR